MTAKRPWAFLLAGLLGAAPAIAQAWELQGVKTLTAHTRDQQRIPLGSVRFEPRGDGSVAFTVALDPARFTDHFLSLTALRPEGRRFPIHRDQDSGTRPMPLTFSPRANTASPAALMLTAAFRSRSCSVAQAGQVQSRTFSGSEARV